MKACTIFCRETDLKAVYDKMVHLYFKPSVQIEGNPEDWTQMVLTIRALLGSSKVTFNAMHDTGPSGQLADMLTKMFHVFQALPSERPDIQEKLLQKIRGVRLAIGVTANRNVAHFEESIFAIAKLLNGMVFWKGDQMLNNKGRIILNFKGHCRVNELEMSPEEDVPLSETGGPEDAIVRKERTEVLLKDFKIPINKNLPPIAGEAETEIREKKEVVDRALAVCLVALKGEGLEQKLIERVMADYEIGPLLSPKERVFVEAEEPSQQERVNFVWRYESFWALLWALGFADSLTYPETICDVQKAVTILRECGSRKAFHEKAVLRDKVEILDQTDLIYRLNWACVDARLRQNDPPGDLETGVVFERHYTMNWLRKHHDADWDDVSTDT